MSITIRSAQTIRTRQPSLVAGLVQTFYTGIFSYDATWFAANTATSTSVVSGWNSNSLFDVSACSAQYLGYFRAPTTGTYLIRGSPDDHLLVWLGSLAVEGFVGDESASPNYLIKAYYQVPDTSNPIALTAGTDHPLRVQWGNEGGGADLLIEYSTDSGSTWNDITPHLYRDVDSTTGFFVPSGGVTLRGHTPPPPIVTAGLVLHYDFSNPACYSTGTSITDLSTVANTGTIVNNEGAISYGTTGLNSYFNWSTNAGESTIGSSIHTAVQNTSTDFTIVFQPDFTATGIVGLFGVETDKSVRFPVTGSGSWTVNNPGDGNDWAYLNTATYYINGQTSITPVAGWNIMGGSRTNNEWTMPNGLYIGTSVYAYRHFQGKIALVLMYNRALTEAEQLQNYAALRARFGL
jgi:hypothetical protein